MGHAEDILNVNWDQESSGGGWYSSKTLKKCGVFKRKLTLSSYSYF